MRVRDLGLLGVEVDGVEQPLRGRRPQVLLARLLVGVNQRVTASELLQVVWGDDIADHTSTLESHIWRLRQTLEPHRPARRPAQVLTTDVDGYRLLARVDDVDSLRFEREAGEIRELTASFHAGRVLQHCDEALSLWRGRPFEPVSDEIWASAAVARLEEMQTEVAATRIDALLDLDQNQQALADLERLIERAPLRERHWSQRMLALHRAGRTDEALEAYQRIRRLLDEELGLAPGVELDRLHHRILDQDAGLVVRQSVAAPALPSDAPRPLPRRTTPLIGRDGDLGRISRLVAGHRLVTLTGVGGCGKTRLALEAGHALASEFPDGVWFVDLATIDDESMVAALVASTLRLAPGVVGSAIDSTVDHLRRRRMLLILDNCEHVLAGAAAFVEQVADADARCAVLLTSREAVAFPGEVIWTLGPLPVDASSTGESSPAVELLLARLSEAVPELEVDDHVREQADRICAAVDGLPLAIELAAARVRTDGLAAVATQAAADPSRLRRLRSTGGTHHDSVGDAIEWSHRTLTVDERILHRRLAVLPGPFTVEAAVALAAPSDGSVAEVPADAVPDLLSLLAHRSLLVPVPPSTSRGRMRFRQLATVRSHARRALTVEGEVAAVEDARDTWVRALVAARPRVFSPDPDRWYDAVDDDFDAVRSTLRRLLVEEPRPQGAAVVTGLAGYWYLRRRLVEGLTWLELAESATGVEPLDQAGVQCALAVRYVLQGRSDLALPHVERARSGLAVAADTGLAWALAGLAYSLLTGAEPRLVAVVLRDVREVASATNDTALAVVVDALAATTAARPDPAEVQAVYDRAVLQDNTFAASICASFFSLYALLTEDPALGELWVGRGRELHRRVGGRAFSGFDENAADFAAMAGDVVRAARLYGASSSAAFRDGTVWPRQSATRELIRRTEDALSREDFLRAWRAGEEHTGV
ncbi:BTAD domain-containing putative transcriptional regulator [Microbacterium sp. RU33B]|uniref:BTAD domain-containing putative transcriptional regulator n=1 Tax=Microbacterium sp. RU33B TaxID=1907390 RepID=UPI000958FBC3|nr:BTAD domain-containing putative transcriptional regulator [Microbacterium sp. RU33B]SIT66572.1 Predicted ATPase [Microbacterium sp. RU33B]